MTDNSMVAFYLRAHTHTHTPGKYIQVPIFHQGEASLEATLNGALHREGSFNRDTFKIVQIPLRTPSLI